jgi:hypothetical protein
MPQALVKIKIRLFSSEAYPIKILTYRSKLVRFTLLNYSYGIRKFASNSRSLPFGATLDDLNLPSITYLP